MFEILFSLDTNTQIFTSIIVLATILAFCYIIYLDKKGKLASKRRWVEQIPSLISALGVLGTFLGITVGLLNFDTTRLEESIPILLDGMKTAFFTSLAGMIGSMVLSRLVTRTFDKADGGVSDINVAAAEIVKAVQAMSEANRETLNELKAQSEKQANNQAAFYVTVGETLTILREQAENQTTQQSDFYVTSGAALSSVRDNSAHLLSILVQAQSATESLATTADKVEEIKNAISQMSLSIGNIEESAENQVKAIQAVQSSTSTIDTSIKGISNNVGEVLETVSSIASTDDEIAAEVKKFGDKLHSEVVEIEDKMDETNKLLTKKFDEFTELLKKSNTEALVEVMKKVTEEFQKQMNALINKLIQENFDQLNKSVERLNTWQQENKEMISSLTAQYKQMATNFENTSSTLSKVGADTQTLVSDGGKLKQLIDTLNKIIIEDTKFVQISANLTETATLAKDNMAKFDESTTQLNEWIRKQRNFVDGVNALIEKLDELNRMRDYGEEFWRSTKENMEEGVSIIREGTLTLNRELRSIDQQFYNRLSATLAELDACIQAMVNGNR